MARRRQDITEAELAVLQVLWDRGPSSVRQLSEAIYGKSEASHYATVQKLLERLETKGCVRRDRGADVQVFSPAIDRDELIGRRLEAVAEQLCGGSWTPLLTHLVRARRLTPQERQELRAHIDALEKETRRKSKRG